MVRLSVSQIGLGRSLLLKVSLVLLSLLLMVVVLRFTSSSPLSLADSGSLPTERFTRADNARLAQYVLPFHSPAPQAVAVSNSGLFDLSWSSFETDWTNGVAWGDYDGDGDLDLAVGNACDYDPNCHSAQLYRNDGIAEGVPQMTLVWGSAEFDDASSVAWADVDGDGDLDLAVGNQWQSDRLYRNDGGTLTASAVYSTAEEDQTLSIAWGDVDGDGDPDLAVGDFGGPNRLYRNDGGTLTASAVYFTADSDQTASVAWGDVDGDGDLDLLAGNSGAPCRLYRNDGGSLTPSAVYSTLENGSVNSVAWGDYDGDGDLDLAVGDSMQPSRLYRNDGGALTANAVYSTTEADLTTSIAWGDYDGDGDLDLAVGNRSEPNRLYRNDGGTLTSSAVWSSAEADGTNDVAWGDYDGDGDLDMAMVNSNPGFTLGQPNRLYRNNSGTLISSAVWSSTDTDGTNATAWGDYDGDGDLDLAVGKDCYNDPSCRSVQLYEADGGTLSVHTVYSSTESDYTTSITWGDYDGDGDLDLAVGNCCNGLPPSYTCHPDRLYRNDDGALTPSAVWSSDETEYTRGVAWGDYDGDGDLDLAVGGTLNRLYRNDGVVGEIPQMTLVWSAADSTGMVAWGDYDSDGDLDLAVGGGPNRLYRNDGVEGEIPRMTLAWSAAVTDSNSSIAWGDYDGDGDLDLAAGNWGQPNRLYRNDAGMLTPLPVWSSVESDKTNSVAWGDVDGDGDLDLAAGNSQTPNCLYRNDGGALTPSAVWSSDEVTYTNSVAWGDVDGDGDLDLAVANGGGSNLLYRNGRDGRALPGSVPVVHVARPGPNADFFSASQTWLGPTVPLTYTLSDPQGDPVKSIRAWYSPDGGGRWLPAAAADTITMNLATTATYVYNWDVFGSGFFGQSDDVVFRIQAAPAIVSRPNQTPGPYLYGTYASQTFPFRVRGTQVRVLSGAAPAANALVYRLPAGQMTGGTLIADSAGHPFRTDVQGYLQGRGQLNEGDRLLALLPITWTESYTLYHTSGVPTVVGVDAYTVTAPGIQTLTVSADHPLVLFNLDVSLEWDTHKDTIYLDQLAFNLQRASEYLYDFTNGQVALGRVNVFQNADEWVYSHVVVQANNRLRPFAAQGGIVFTDTIDPQHDTVSDTIRYSPGQVTMGSVWNRYGNPGQSLGEDWPIILAHELSHYLLFHDDTYIGMDPDGFLVPISTCLGSAMGDLYSNPDNTEFIADEGYWQANCADTLAEQTLERNEWETMQLWYPGLIAPAESNSGPAMMSFDLTTVQIHDPYTPTDTLVDPTFYIDYQGGGGSSSEARAYLDRDEYVVNLGSPFGGQNRVIARGAQPGDRLCVFDRSRAQFGCEMIELGDDRLAMRLDTDWNPIVQISPVNSATLTIHFSNTTPIPFPLYARVFPDLGYGEAPIPLTLVGDVYSGTFELTYPAMSGNVQVWVDEPFTETDPRREAIVAYSIGGNPGTMRGAGGTMRGAGGTMRGAGGTMRGAGGTMRGAGAPIISPDGQMIFFTENPIDFAVGTFFTIQGMAGLPPLPPGRTLVGQGYNLVASPGVSLPTGSVSIQYLSNDVLVAGASEEDLTLYYWDGVSWAALNTVLDTYFNLASAPSQGEGVYTLMASVKIPLYGPGWNNFAYSVHATRPVSEALLSIRGYYTTVYGYEPTDTTDPWKVYDTGVPTYVNDLEVLEFGKGYWINVSQAITLHLASGVSAMAADATMPLPPATFYGTVLAGNSFTPTAGMTVTTWVLPANAQCGQGRTQEWNEQIVYVVDVFADGEPGGRPGCGAPGRTVRFSVAGQAMFPTAMWGNNQLWHLDPSPGAQRAYLPLILRNENTR